MGATLLLAPAVDRRSCGRDERLELAAQLKRAHGFHVTDIMTTDEQDWQLGRACQAIEDRDQNVSVVCP